jgi:hypothetical protein
MDDSSSTRFIADAAIIAVIIMVSEPIISHYVSGWPNDKLAGIFLSGKRFHAFRISSSFRQKTFTVVVQLPFF